MSKIIIPIKKKWTGGVAQTVELLHCKWEALSSNKQTKKQKKE
jgi:hypothetical protein